MTPTAATRLYALLGDPVHHSLSPMVQNAAFAAAGIDAVYVALKTAGAHVAALIASLASAGGGGNVTIPHKLAAAGAVDVPEPVVTRTGACNTFWGDAGRVRGDNTDVAGFRSAAEQLAGSVRGARSLVFGAGGAARAAACALLDEGGTIDIVARSLPAARELCERLDPGGARIRLHAGFDDVREVTFDFVVNATPLGLRPEDPVPVPLEILRRPAAVIDLVCVAAGSELDRSARRMGIPSCDGAAMLLAQAAAAFERWWDRAAPVDVMRDALLRGLAGERRV